MKALKIYDNKKLDFLKITTVTAAYLNSFKGNGRGTNILRNESPRLCAPV